MAQQPDSVCPECGAAQIEDGPFCDNCGYRIGRADTEIEGHRAIVRRASPRKPVGVATEIERPAIKPRKPSGPALSNRESTEMEGVAVVNASQEIPTERNPPVDPSRFAKATFAPSLPTEVNTPVDPIPSVLASPDTEADLVPVRPLEPPTASHVGDHDGASSRSLWLLAWAVSLVATAMFVHFLSTPNDAPSAPTASIDAPKPARIEVPSGTFNRGLDERVRSMILSTCLKMADDPKTDCEHDELLAGEFPADEAEVGAYAIDALEVSVGDYDRCVTANQCTPIDWKSCRVYTLNGLQVSLRAPKSLRGPAVAVTCVSREQAETFCAWRTGRLPTHEEWERAARGAKDKRIYPWGSVWEPLYANWGELDVVRMPIPGAIDGHEMAAPPGSYPNGKSPIGAFDMAGNVSEWVGGEPVSARGGSWTSTPFDLRVTARLRLDESATRSDVGFRCAY